MNFASENLFPLIIILCVTIFLIIRSVLTGKIVDYPSIRYFKGSKTKQGNIPGIIKEILKFVCFLTFLISLLIYFLKPTVFTEKSEQAIIVIDRTPYIDADNEFIENIKDSLILQEAYNNIFIKEIYSSQNKLIKKQEIIKRIDAFVDEYSADVFLITDRGYNNNAFSVIKVNSNFPEIMISKIGNIITVYSKKDTTISLELLLGNSQVYKEYVNVIRGINYIDFAYRGFFDKIIAHFDTLIIPEKIQLQSAFVNDKTNNYFIRRILNVLGYRHSESGEIEISYDDNISKGIVIAQYGEAYIKKGDRSFSLVNGNFPMNLKFAHLEFEKITINPGNPIIISSFGEQIINRDSNKFYINIPADTGLSNLLLLPETIILFDILLSNYTNSVYENSLLTYRNEIINNNSYSYSAKYKHPFRNIEHIFLYIACIAFILFTVLSIV